MFRGENKIIMKPIIAVLYFLYLFSLLCSMAGMELFGWGTFALVAVIGVYEYIRYKKNPIPFHPLTKYILVFAVTLIISVVFSPYVSNSEKHMWHYIGRTRPALLFIFNLIILERFVSYKSAVKWFSWFLLPLVLIITFMAASGYDPVRGVHTFNWDWSFSKGIAGFFVTYMEYANIYELYFFILAAFLLLYKEFKTAHKIWLWITIIATLFSLMVGGSRAVFLSIPFAFIVQMLVSKNKKVFIYMTLVLILGGIAAFSLSPFVRAKARFTVSNIDKFGDINRYTIWRSHIALFKDNPITGAGFEMAGQEHIQSQYFNKIGISNDYYNSHYRHMVKKAHNMFLDILSGSGVIGFCAFILLLVAYTIYFWKTLKAITSTGDTYDKVFIIGLAGASATMLSNMLFDMNLDNLRMVYSIVFVVSLTAHLGLKYGVKTIFTCK
ncbi:MAG: O-antigen ligase family protein [bacterium]